MSLSHQPKLPPELEKQIFETVVLEWRYRGFKRDEKFVRSLQLVAQRVHVWCASHFFSQFPPTDVSK